MMGSSWLTRSGPLGETIDNPTIPRAPLRRLKMGLAGARETRRPVGEVRRVRITNRTAVRSPRKAFVLFFSLSCTTGFDLLDRHPSWFSRADD
jgi:hypothetical protein